MTPIESGTMSWMWRARRAIAWIAAGILAAILVTLLAWGVHRWWTYPQAPDVAAVDVNTAIDFMGTDAFNRMLERHRLAYALSVVDRLDQLSLTELMALMMRREANRAEIARNLRQIEGHEQIGARMFAMFLEKYYALKGAERQAALVAIALAQQGQIMQNPEQFGLPTAEQFRRDMTRFMSRQPPRVQAMCGQFLIDLKHQRDRMGLPDPF